jgi:N-acyl-D-aspartate/D-glutamate deacylase
MLDRRFAYGCFVATILSAQIQVPPAIVLQHANVIDGVSSQPALDVTIVLRDGKIASIGAASPNDSTGAHIIDLAGRWVLPGLIDAHTHVNTIAAATAALESGLTTVRIPVPNTTLTLVSANYTAECSQFLTSSRVVIKSVQTCRNSSYSTIQH